MPRIYREVRVIDGVEHIYCATCKELKPRDAFNKHNKSPYAVQSRCIACRAFKHKTYVRKPGWREYMREYSRQNLRRLREAAISHYSKGKNECWCCGEKTYEFLAINHTNGNGSEHRRQINGSIYQWLKNNNYPDGFDILCHNCNAARGFYGYCPHEKRLEVAV